MHCNADVTADALQQCVNDLRERKIESVPFTRSPLARWSVTPCYGDTPKLWYAMRGNAIHASLVSDLAAAADAEASIEDTLHTKCRAGPQGREVSASTVKGFPHLLQVRSNDQPPTPYVKECLFLPPVVKDMIGVPDSVLSQDHRQFPKRIIDMPVEIDGFRRRGAEPPQRPGGGIRYPDAYIRQVKEQRQAFAGAELSELTKEQYDMLKKQLPQT